MQPQENSSLPEAPKTQNNQITGNIAVTSKSGFSPGEMTDHLICTNQTSKWYFRNPQQKFLDEKHPTYIILCGSFRHSSESNELAWLHILGAGPVILVLEFTQSR